MTIPLVQGLINSLLQAATGDMEMRERARIYAFALVPRLTACRPSVAHNLLQNVLLPNDNNTKYGDDVLNNAIYFLESVYPCLGVTCEDINPTPIIPAMSACTNPRDNSPFGGNYSPSSTTARTHAMIDLDVRQFSILVGGGAFEAAKMLYTFGHNARKTSSERGTEYISLASLATDPARSRGEPFYGYFVMDARSTF